MKFINELERREYLQVIDFRLEDLDNSINQLLYERDRLMDIWSAASSYIIDGE